MAQARVKFLNLYFGMNCNDCWLIIIQTEQIGAQIIERIILIVVLFTRTKMKSAKKERAQPLEEVDPKLRRSSRQRKETKHDGYIMGSVSLEDILGAGYYEDDCYPKRRRKNYQYDDSDDYSQGHKYSKKSKLINPNKVEALLQWKYQLDMLPIIVNYLPEQQQGVSLQTFHKLKTAKNVSAENLASLGTDIQAVFINIDWGKKGQTIKDFSQLKIESNKFMSKGLVFVWAPKQSISQMLTIMQKKDFTYVENFEIINFDIEKAKLLSRPHVQYVQKNKQNEDKTQIEDFDTHLLIKSLSNVDPSDLIADQKSKFFNVSKRTLLMFKKNSNEKFELRHQRTCDVVFDMPVRLGQKCDSDLKSYIYHMIQTLLPDCLTVNQINKIDYDFKMMEIWADKASCRRGWISVVQE